jgi:hypothetical protein
LFAIADSVGRKTNIADNLTTLEHMSTGSMAAAQCPFLLFDVSVPTEPAFGKISHIFSEKNICI